MYKIWICLCLTWCWDATRSWDFNNRTWPSYKDQVFSGERWRQDWIIYSLFWRPEQLSSDMTLATLPWRMQVYCTSIPGNNTNNINDNTKSAVHDCHALLSKAHDSSLSGWKDLSEGSCMRNQAHWFVLHNCHKQIGQNLNSECQKILLLLVLLCVLWS